MFSIAVYNVLTLGVYTPFDLQLRTCPCIFLILIYKTLVDKKTYFESHNHQKNLYLKSCVSSFTTLSCSAFNSAFVVSVFTYYLNQSYL